MARFPKSPTLLALGVISDARATHDLQECQGIELQKVEVLIPTTSISNVRCKVELLELHPSDNREELHKQEGVQVFFGYFLVFWVFFMVLCAWMLQKLQESQG